LHSARQRLLELDRAERCDRAHFLARSSGRLPW
jgi:hypothetical protein